MLATTLVVVLVTYVAIVVGELVPKRLGQISAETVARLAARPMGVLSLVSRPFVMALTGSTNLILVEIFNEAIGALVMTWGVYRASRNRPGDNTDVPLQREWLRNNMRRMIDFGVKGYTQGLIILPYGGMVNRLVAGNQFTAIQVALFGFAQSIFDQLQRYLPAQLFNGMIRPVMAARYSANGSYQEAETVANAALTVNLVLIGLAATFFAAGGGDLYLWLSKGKYGSDANLLILMMCLVMALESWRHSLENLSHTVERYGFLVFSNLFLGLSLLLGVALAPQFGIVALPAANGRSAEAEHRAILLETLQRPPRKPLAEILASMPDVGGCALLQSLST